MEVLLVQAGLSRVHNYIGLQHNYGTIDCIKLIQLVYKSEFNIEIELPEYSHSKRWIKEFSVDSIEKILSKNTRKISLTDANNFDLMIFKQGNNISHFGVFIKPFKLLHVEEHSTSKIEDLNPYWINYLYGVYRHDCLV